MWVCLDGSSMVGIALTLQLEDRILASQNKEVCYRKEATCPYTYFAEQIHTILWQHYWLFSLMLVIEETHKCTNTWFYGHNCSRELLLSWFFFSPYTFSLLWNVPLAIFPPPQIAFVFLIVLGSSINQGQCYYIVES